MGYALRELLDTSRRARSHPLVVHFAFGVRSSPTRGAIATKGRSDARDLCEPTGRDAPAGTRHSGEKRRREDDDSGTHTIDRRFPR